MRVSDDFHRFYEKHRIWEGTNWLGINCQKLPFDAFILQEIIFNTRPDVIIETGTCKGGSALFFASICELIGNGKILTIDVKEPDPSFKDIVDKHHPYHNMRYKISKLVDRIKFIKGDSVSDEIVSQVKDLVFGRCMVILDSWHTKDHVLKEMQLYNGFVAVGCYMVVEDTHVSGHPVPWQYGEGPMEAVKEFLSKNDDFIVDKNCEKMIMTFCPNGFLKKVK